MRSYARPSSEAQACSGGGAEQAVLAFSASGEWTDEDGPGFRTSCEGGADGVSVDHLRKRPPPTAPAVPDAGTEPAVAGAAEAAEVRPVVCASVDHRDDVVDGRVLAAPAQRAARFLGQYAVAGAPPLPCGSVVDGCHERRTPDGALGAPRASGPATRCCVCRGARMVAHQRAAVYSSDDAACAVSMHSLQVGLRSTTPPVSRPPGGSLSIPHAVADPSPTSCHRWRSASPRPAAHHCSVIVLPLSLGRFRGCIR